MIRPIVAAAAMVTMLAANVALADVVVCPLDEAMKRLEDYNTHLNAAVAQQQMPILTELEALTQKAKNPALPTGAQLTKADQERFQKLREQMLAVQAQEIVNSGYLRDSRVIVRAAKIARDLSVGRTIDD